MATKEQRIAHLENKLKQLRAEAKRRDRRDDTRRKILYGAAFIALADSVGADRRKNMMDKVNEFISRPVDREFLGLSPSPASEQREAQYSLSGSLTKSLPFGSKET